MNSEINVMVDTDGEVIMHEDVEKVTVFLDDDDSYVLTDKAFICVETTVHQSRITMKYGNEEWTGTTEELALQLKLITPE